MKIFLEVSRDLTNPMMVGDKAYIIESNCTIREVQIKRCSGGLFLVRFTTAAAEFRCGATASLPRTKKRSRAFQSPAPQRSRSAIRMIIGIDIGKRRGKERNTPGYFFRAATAERKNAEMVFIPASFCLFSTNWNFQISLCK